MWKCHYFVYEMKDGREVRRHRSFTMPQAKYAKEQATAEIHFRQNERGHEGVDLAALGEAMAYFEAADSTATTFVYGIMNDHGRCLKIGFSKDPENRMRQLQASNAYPLRIAFCFHGTIADEQRLHIALQDSAAENEWYRLTPTIREFVKRVRDYEDESVK